MSASSLAASDRQHQIHSLHHPADLTDSVICVSGHGIIVRDVGGKEYIDGLSGLWNVNVGHGRTELAEAAAAQMKELAYFSAYTGSSNLPAVQLAEKLIGLAYDNMQAVFF